MYKFHQEYADNLLFLESKGGLLCSCGPSRSSSLLILQPFLPPHLSPLLPPLSVRTLHPASPTVAPSHCSPSDERTQTTKWWLSAFLGHSNISRASLFLQLYLWATHRIHFWNKDLDQVACMYNYKKATSRTIQDPCHCEDYLLGSLCMLMCMGSYVCLTVVRRQVCATCTSRGWASPLFLLSQPVVLPLLIRTSTYSLVLQILDLPGPIIL